MPHRLFIGIRPPSEVRDDLLDLMDGIDGARWQDDDQLHLTLRYIGETDAHRADDLAESLTGIAFSPFELQLRDTGLFQRKGRPHTLWTGVEPSGQLRALQTKIERRCQSVGFAPETRKFHPHITLARLNTSTGSVGPFLEATAGRKFGGWKVDSYILYESHLRPEGSLYEPIVRYSAIEKP